MKTFKFAVLTMAACVCLGGAKLFAGSPIVYQTVALPVFGYTPSCANGTCPSAVPYATSAYYPSQTWNYAGSVPASGAGTVIYSPPVPKQTYYSAPSPSYTVGATSCGPNGCPAYVTRGTSYVLPGNTVRYVSPTCTTGNCPNARSYSTYKVVPAYSKSPVVNAATPFKTQTRAVGSSVGRGSPFYP